jgi:uncharacterized protein
MTLEELQRAHSRAILYECIAGSRAYGTNTTASDEDIRGIFAVPAADYLLLKRPSDQVSDARGNVVYYSLRRVIDLLSVANPNILELLFMPADCNRVMTPEMSLLVEHRQIFITKQCADTHAGYAMSQIKKARGQNKWINNPKPERAPAREEYCYVIPWNPVGSVSAAPVRPVPLSVIGWSLEEFHAARLEHARDIYRLYRYGCDARGVFRGDVLVCESIPKEDEASRFAGLLLFNEQAWKQAQVDHQNYWAWRHERNPSRWAQQERGELDFDAKNLMHTVRLLMSALSILKEGRPRVRFAGRDLDTLMSIRAGHQSFEQIMSLAENLMSECEVAKESCALPDACDVSQASALLGRITAAWEQRVG